MCGYAGFLNISGKQLASSHDILVGMGNAIFLRGPDSGAVWIDEPVGMVHRRLAVLELSDAGAQPMHSYCGRYVLVFNGEIYNHDMIRVIINKVSHINWRGGSDTETLINAISVIGIDETLKHVHGMFSFALWDKVDKKMILARDRTGEKPLVYTIANGFLVFGSDVNAIGQFPSLPLEIDSEALELYFQFNNVPAPMTIFKGVKKVLPGNYIVIDSCGGVQEKQYWHYGSECFDLSSRSEEDVINSLESMLDQAVKSQMHADVPLGAFLSGGVDSSLIAALMQKNSSRPVKTFTIGFNDKKYNEAEHAAKVAKFLGTDHSELYLDAGDVLDIVPNIASYYDEPFADSSQIPTYLVSRMARSKVTVSLSGDGADELFGGYNRHKLTHQNYGRLLSVPGFIRHSGASFLTKFSPNEWDSIYNRISSILPKGLRMNCFGEKVYKISQALKANSADDLYASFVTHWDPRDGLINRPVYSDYLARLGGAAPLTKSVVDKMMYCDFVNYLPNDVLVKVDRAAMASSLETRAPFLDRDILNFSSSLPVDFKIRNGETKWILRKILYKYVPRDLLERPKMGFGVPIDSWLRSELRDWAEDLLSNENLGDLFNMQLVENIWSEHLSGKKDHQHKIWCILMFSSWKKSFFSKVR